MTEPGRDPRIEELTRRLGAGEPPAALALSMLDEPAQDTLARCAAVPVFDAGLYDQVLRGAGPVLGHLVDSRLVRPIGDAGYRMESAVRDEAWKRWWTEEDLRPGANTLPTALRGLGEELVRQYRSTDQPLEELRQLLLVDAAGAAALFEQLFDAADQRFDLARCQDLLDILYSPDRAHLIPIELAELRNARRVHLAARNLWAGEYHQSARYFPRPELEQPLRDLLLADGLRVIQLCAQGGMGKTMQLRWFVARHCRALAEPIPCARIDFDHTDPVNAARLPWLLLLEIADQLDRQLVGAPFQDLLQEHGQYRAALALGDTAGAGADVVDSATALEEDAADIRLRFTRVLAERPADQAVVVILDTFEQVVTRPAIWPDALLTLLREVHDAAPALRLVIAGRNDLRAPETEQLPHFPAARTVSVHLLRADECRRYLTEVRGVTDPELVAAITDKSGGLPFTLALFGDLAVGPHPPTAAEVRDATGPALLYCIERVLERIPNDQVRWLLRYGAVPRLLTFDFVRHVMWPPLVESIGGSSTDDDPDEDDRPRAGRPAIFQEGTPPTDEVELRALWDQLAAFASGSSWISHTDAEPGALVLHPIVRGPLRQLVGAQGIYRRLHADALAYYRGLAAENGPLRVRLLSHVVYHQCHLDPGAAIEDWRAAVAAAHASGRPGEVKALVDGVLADETADHPEAVVEWVIPPRIRYEASIEVARDASERARAQRASRSNPLWSEVVKELEEASQLLADHPELGLPSARHLLLTARLFLTRGDRSGATRLAFEVAAGTGVDARDAQRLLAEAELVRGEADSSYQGAFGLSIELGDRAGAVEVTLEAVDRHLAHDEFDAAATWLRRLPAVEGQRLDVLARRALLKLVTGEPAAALATLAPIWPEPADPLGDTEPLRRALTLNRAWDTPGTAAAAMRVLAEAPMALCRPGTTAALWISDAIHSRYPLVSLTVARAKGALLRIDAAAEEVRVALRNAGSDPDRAGLAAAAGAELQLRVVGSLIEAEQQLDEGDRHRPEPGGDAWLALRLGRSELLGAASRLGEAHALLRATMAALPEDAAPSHRARIAVYGLTLRSVDGSDQVRYAEWLLAALDRLESPGAQLVALRELSRCPDLGAAADLLRPTLERIGLEVLTDPDRYAQDVAVAKLTLAEIRRLLGSARAARSELDRVAVSLGAVDPWVWWEWVQAVQRLGPAARADRLPPDGFLDAYGAADTPLLCAAFVLELADWRLALDPIGVTRSRLADATDWLSAAGPEPTRVHARLDAVRYRLAVRDGSQEAAREHAALAAAIWAQLGDYPRQLRYLAQTGLNAGLVVQGAETRTAAVGVGARMAEVPGEIRVSVTGAVPERVQATIAGFAYQRFRESQTPRWLDPANNDPLANAATIDALLGNGWPAEAGVVLRDLGSCLRGTQLGTQDVRLELVGPQSAALPWELTRIDGVPLLEHRGVSCVYRGPDPQTSERATTLQLQRALMKLDRDPGPLDGLYGPMTAGAVHSLTGRYAAELADVGWAPIRRALTARKPLRVWLLSQSLNAEISWGRGDRGSGSEAEPIYRSAGLSVAVIEDPSLDTVRSAAAATKSGPDVLHITAAMERSGRVPALSFGRSGEPFTAKVIDKVIALCGGNRGAPPLVVLEVTAPHSEFELVRQLLLRNEFLHAVGALGTGTPVLALGLLHGSAAGAQREALAHGLAAGAGAGELWRRVRSRGSAVTDTAALWSAAPPHALLPPGVW